MNDSIRAASADLLDRLDVATYFFTFEMIIDSPQRKVWRKMLDYHEWNPAHVGARIDRLAGKKSEEGEIIREYKRSGDGYEPPIIIETVKVIPNTKIVWAMYSAETGASNDIGFVDFSLYEMNGRTKFVYNTYGWCNSHAIGNDREEFERGVHEQLNRQLPALRAHAESAPDDGL